jgi:transcription initiation factor TFIIA small subunit
MAGVFMHYRCSSVGIELQKCLDDLVDSEALDEDQARTISEHFDKAMCQALANDAKTKATIKGSLHHYRNHDDIWTFYLDDVDVKLDNSVTLKSSERMRIISVGKR